MSQSQKYHDTLASSAALQADIEANKSPKSASKRSKFKPTNRFVKGLYSTLCVLQIIGAALIIALTAVKLDVDVESAEGVYSKEFCYQLNDSVNTCTYTYWSAGISIGVSITLLLFAALCHGGRGRCCLTIESILSMCGVAWWVAAGVVSTITSDNASAANLGEHAARLALWIMCYAVGGLFGGTMLLSMGTLPFLAMFCHYLTRCMDVLPCESPGLDGKLPHAHLNLSMCHLVICRRLLLFLLPGHEGRLCFFGSINVM